MAIIKTPNFPKVSTVRRRSPQETTYFYRRGLAEYDRLKEEANRRNRIGSLAWKTLTGTPRSIRNIGVEAVKNPLNTSRAIGSSMVNVASDVLSNSILPLQLFNSARRMQDKKPIRFPKINYEPTSEINKAIHQGFGVGATAGTYMAGTAALRPLLSSPKIASFVGRYLPKALTTHAGTGERVLRPLAQELISDQIVGQAVLGPDATIKDRLFSAATAPLFTGALHGLGRGFQLAGKPITSALRGMKGSPAHRGALSRSTKSSAPVDVNSPFYNPATNTASVDDYLKRAVEEGEGARVDESSALGKLWNRIFSSGRANVQRQGPAGKAIATVIDEQQYQEGQWLAKYLPGLNKYLNNLDDNGLKRLDTAVRTPGGKSLLKSQDEKMAYEIWDQIRKEVDIKAQGKIKLRNDKGKKIDWLMDSEDVGTYAPKYYEGKVKNSPEFRASLVKEYMKKNPGADRVTAAKEVDRFLEDSPIRRAGSLEYAREWDNPNFIRDPRVYMHRYLKQVARRVPEIELFGQEHEKLLPLMNQIEEAGGDTGIVRKVLDTMYGSKIDNKFVSTAMKWNLFSKLSLSAFQNLTQTTNTMAQGGIFKTLGVIKDYVLHPSRRAAMKDLADLGDSFDEVLISSEAAAGDSLPIKLALYIFKKSEKLNRGIAANVGARQAVSLNNALKVSPDDEVVRRGLAALGLNVDEIVKQGKVTQEDMARAAFNMVESTQFRINPMNLPVWSRSTWGKFFTQFKSFGYMQTRFYRDQIIREARQGNLMPLVRMMITAPPAFYFAAKLRNLVTRNPEKKLSEEEKDRAMFEFMLNLSGTLPGQMIESAMYAQGKWNKPYTTPISKGATALGNILGPTVSDIGRVITGFEQSGDIIRENNDYNKDRPASIPRDEADPWYPQKRFIAGNIPYFGPLIKNRFVGTFPEIEGKKFSRELRANIKEAIINHDMDALRELARSMSTQHEIDVFERALSEMKKEVSRERMNPNERAIYEELENRIKELRYLPLMK